MEGVNLSQKEGEPEPKSRVKVDSRYGGIETNGNENTLHIVT